MAVCELFRLRNSFVQGLQRALPWSRSIPNDPIAWASAVLGDTRMRRGCVLCEAPR